MSATRDRIAASPPVPSPSTVEPIPVSAWRVLVLGSLANFVMSFAGSVMTVAFPDLRQRFPHASPAELSWVLNSYTIVSGGLLILAAACCDRFGRKRMLLTGIVTFTLAALACAVAPNVGFLIGARTVQGIGGALIPPAAVAVILAQFPVTRRGTAIAVWTGIGGIATALGPSVGGTVIDAGSWRWAFWMTLPVGVVVALLGARAFREASPDELVRGPLPDPLAALALTAGVVLGILGLVKSPTWTWNDGRTIGCLVASAVLLAAFLWRTQRVTNPLIELDLLLYRNMRLAVVLAIGFGIGFFAMFFGLVLFLTSVWHYSLTKAGFLVAPVPTVIFLAAPPAGRLADRVGHRVIAVPGGVAWAAGAVILLAGAHTPRDLAIWFPAVILLGLGAALAYPTMQGIPVIGIPASRVGAATATIFTVLRLASAVGAALAITLITGEDTSAASTFQPIFILMVASGAALALVGTRVSTAPSSGPG
jgi:EmrB/QacA subfamily drug resistance transporter